MLTAEGCRNRRLRLWDRLPTRPPEDILILADPLNLRYLANVYVDPFSYGADFNGILVVKADGHSTFYHDNRLPGTTIAQIHADEKTGLVWYDGVTAGKGPRRLFLQSVLKEFGGRIHDSLGDTLGATILETVGEMRRQKDPDEVALLRACMKAGDISQAWARTNVKAGMSEIEVYNGIFSEVSKYLGHWATVYGDFAVSPGPSRKGGPPTTKVLKNGDMMILDYSVIIQGYRSDFTNTLCVGGEPNSDQTKLYEACIAAMKAGESVLKAGNPCQAVYDAVKAEFSARGLAEHFPHHAGHGLGISHPEAPFLVKNSSETLLTGDVITLEPGLYIDGVGGIRIEHNYLITETGYEVLSGHEITLK